ncbi:MAG TPA: MFS transporter [Ktedonobacteraceae bacterium]|nr:MFS transporter [Ktedonobacteraceae bacterium]
MSDTQVNTGRISLADVPQYASQQERSHNNPILGLVAICAGYFMVILDATIVTLATSNIQQQLGAMVSDLQWVLDGYTLVFAAILLTAGALGDRLGSRRIFLLGMMLFTGSSVLCGLAPTLWVLQSARVIQGIGAALQVPASLTLLHQMFHDQKQRDRAIGLWGGIAGIATAIGPVLGGLLVGLLGWRSIFFVNLPIGILAILLTFRHIPARPGLSQRGLDLFAQVAAMIALGLLTLAIIEGNTWGWTSLPILGSFAGSLVTMLLFLFIEQRAHSPMLPLSLFRSPTFSATNSVGLLINLGFYGQLLLINLFFQNILKYPPLLAGLALLPEGGVVTLTSMLSGRVTAHVGPRLPMLVGLFVGACGFLLMLTIHTSTPYLLLCPMLITIGFGMSFTMPAMTTAAVASAPKERTGIASAVLNMSRQIGSVLGYALLGSLVSGSAMFVSGLHVAMAISSATFFLACLLTLLFVKARPRTKAAVLK